MQCNMQTPYPFQANPVIVFVYLFVRHFDLRGGDHDG